MRSSELADHYLGRQGIFWHEINLKAYNQVLRRRRFGRRRNAAARFINTKGSYSLRIRRVT